MFYVFERDVLFGNYRHCVNKFDFYDNSFVDITLFSLKKQTISLLIFSVFNSFLKRNIEVFNERNIDFLLVFLLSMKIN